MNKEIEKVDKKIKELYAKKATIQSACEHKNVKGEYNSDTGNWCQQDDSYWISADCLDCGNHIYADSERDKDLYLQLSRSGMIK